MEIRTAAKVAFFWYAALTILIIFLMAYGHGDPSPRVYLHGDERDNWWYPPKIIVVLLFTAVIPIPHVLISLLFESKRSLLSVFSIVKRWYQSLIALFALFLAGSFLYGVILLLYALA